MKMRAVPAAIVATALLLSGYGGSTKSAAATSNTSGDRTYTIGILTDMTGPAASGFLSTPLGVKAGIGAFAGSQYHIKYVVGDTGETPAGALVAAQTLVDHDHVFAVVAQSAVTFAAAPFLLSHGIPVIGAAADASEWLADRNMFSIFGTQDFTKVETTTGKFFKLEGVTNAGLLGYGLIPSSNDAAKGDVISVEAAGIKAGYVNTNLPYGSTNVGPIALAMKAAGINGLAPAVEGNSSLALVTALKQEGVKLKASLLATGYGGDLQEGGPGAAQAAQGVDFASSYEPVEMHTAATEHLQNALRQYAGVTGDPTLSEYIGYLSIDALIIGLKAAGPDATQASFINAMLGITHYAAAGLYGSHSIGFALSTRGQAAGADNCEWVTRYSGSTFHLIPGADPICGSVIPGKSV